ncbi:MAG: 2-phosphosulfolactate phosphatase [Candidatus Dormiibacterota bacterium]
MTGRSFAIDALPKSVDGFIDSHAIVAIDVLRANTVIVTGLVGGREVYPVDTVARAVAVGARLDNPLLAGEQGGVMPRECEIDNSPATLAGLDDRRPLVLVTSAGTKLLARAQAAAKVYVACLRNLTATASKLVASEDRVALIGAGTRGEARVEDQLVCARIGMLLLEAGFEPETERTWDELIRWAHAPIELIESGRSAEYLRTSGHAGDVDFVLAHVDDVPRTATFSDGQAALMEATAAAVTPPIQELAVGR